MVSEVWIVEAGHDYEGSDILGVFDSRNKAEVFAQKVPTDPENCNIKFPHYYDFKIVRSFKVT